MHFYGSASAEPFFIASFPENWGARLRISGGCPARGEPEALIDLCSSIACRAQPCQRCTPVLQALIIFQMHFYGSASAEPFFVALFPENWGARLRISGGCPARGEPEALINLCSSIACRAQPCQRCSPVLQALIISQYATLRLCFGRAVFVLRGGSAAKRCIPPFFARQTVLYYNSIGACRKGSKPVRFTQGSVSRARCTEKAVF